MRSGFLKKDLGTFVRFYKFNSRIVDYDDKELEKLGLTEIQETTQSRRS